MHVAQVRGSDMSKIRTDKVANMQVREWNGPNEGVSLEIAIGCPSNNIKQGRNSV